ncbi:MAG TPA: hypothetical protein VF995_11425 [Actinomycetota bacterium]
MSATQPQPQARRGSRPGTAGQDPPEQEPNGGIVAAVIAAGAACAVLGILTVLAAAVPALADVLTFYAPAGPITGKFILATIAYLIIWANLHFRLRGRELSLSKGFVITLLLLMTGLIGTFPPFYQLFGHGS